MHPDARTIAPDTEYFFLGNGEMSTAIQWSRNPAMAPYGIVLMQSGTFCRKESTLLFHPEFGLSRTMLTVTVDGIRCRPRHENVQVRWASTDPITPVVAVEWKAGELTVTELFGILKTEKNHTDKNDEAEEILQSYLVRQVLLTGPEHSPTSASGAAVELAFYSNPYVLESYPVAVEDRNTLIAAGKGLVCGICPTGEEKEAVLFERFITVRRDLTPRTLNSDVGTEAPPARNRTASPITFLYAVADQWTGPAPYHVSLLNTHPLPSTPKNSFAERLLRQFDLSRIGLNAAVASNGRFDASIWQYGYEWGQDAAMIASGAAYAGEYTLAKALLGRILEALSNEEGQIAESSRFRDGELAELNANGATLLALRDYVVASDDRSHLERYWERIVAIAELPLQEEYLHESGLIVGRRDLWERLPWMGLQTGFDTATNTFCAEGLLAAAELATMRGETGRAERWREAGTAMREGMIGHEQFSCIAEGRIVHRRLTDGSVQKTMTAEAGYHDTRYAPYVPTHAADSTPRPCDPDSTAALPILYDIVNPASDAAHRTLAHLREHLWNTTGIGGYARSPIASDPDSPGPWPFVTAWMAEAELRAGMIEQARETTEWLLRMAESGGSWFEYYGERNSPPFPPIGVIVWGWGQYLLLFIRGWMGVEFKAGQLRIAPRIAGFSHVLRAGAYPITVEVTGLSRATVNGLPTQLRSGGIELKLPIERDYHVAFSA